MSGENKRNVRPVKVGGLVLDGKKIYIQSMLNVPSTDIEGSVKQAVELEKAGCEIVRAAIPNMEAVKLTLLSKRKSLSLLWRISTLTIALPLRRRKLVSTR